MSDIIPIKKLQKPQDLVLRFMNSVGHKKDAEFYLKLFNSTHPESFALIVLEEDILKEDIDSIIFELRYLMRLSLYPIVVIRSSNDFMDKLEIENYFKKAKMALNCPPDHYTHSEKLEFIKERIHKQYLPLLHMDPDLDMAAEITKLASVLRTGKVIFLKPSGGIINTETQSPINLINLRFEGESLIKSNLIDTKDAQFLKTCEQIIKGCDHKIILSIVSPNNLLRELFTVKGAGTLIQLGSKINSFDSLKNIDPRSLKKLLETSFGKKINKAFFDNNYDCVYIEENYMGAAILKKHKDMSYLSKFAVGTEARGLGIGRDLWKDILKNHPRFFWRSRPDIFITHWYIKQCDGMHRTKDWTVFWKGLKPTEVSDAIEYAINQESDFIESTS